MKKTNSSLFSIGFLILILFGVFYFMTPVEFGNKTDLSEFSTERAFGKVKEICKTPHYVGSKSHDHVALFLLEELKQLGLKPIFQEGYTMTEGGTLVKSKNIIARFKGKESGKALLLLSHYDSAPHSSSYGASDDAAGIATVLESIRAFTYNKTNHKNDIIILFSDAEELGLNGAALFVTQHQWAKDVGLVLNLEARGTSGPSYMLMETNQGNANMVQAFENAGTKNPVANSLMYSIYKMLPNDTDLTVFREQGKVQGFNFAFIDNHFNYHTAQDNIQNLDKQSLAHQGNYLLPSLNYFSNADLSQLDTINDSVYFTTPFGFWHYPFSWILPMLWVAIGLFLFIVVVGMGKKIFDLKLILKGSLKTILLLITSGGITYFGWKLILNIYPQFKDILQGFTYNGHDYIYGFTSVTIALCFLFYQGKGKLNQEMNYSIAPLFIWLLINIGLAYKLQGGAFFIIPVLGTLFMLGGYVITQKSNNTLNLVLSVPTLILLVPFIIMFPIGLGLKILFGSAILTALCFGLLLPVFGVFQKKSLWSAFFVVIAISFFAKAHFSSTYTKEHSKPNSLVYLLNADKDIAYWATYDNNLDEWTHSVMGIKPKKATILNKDMFYSKYGSQFTYMSEATSKNIATPTIEFLRDEVKGNQHFYKIKITPNRKVNRYDIFNNLKTKINYFKANGVKPIEFSSAIASKSKEKVITYYVVDNEPLVLEFSIYKKHTLGLSLYESSFDLLTNPNVRVPKRKDWMMPTPFVLNDAVIVKQALKPSPILDNDQIKAVVNESN